MSLVDKLTIILTLKGRRQFTYRWLDYMNIISFPFNIHIADGGSGQLREDLCNNNRYPNLKFAYRWYGEDINYQAYYQKLLNAVSSVDTEYVFMADNDDFLIPQKMSETIEFLDKHPDYSSCGGRPFIFYNIRKRNDINDLVYGDCFRFYEDRHGENNLSNDFVKRILFSLNHYYDYGWYNIVRTHALKDVFSDLVKSRYSRVMWPEFVNSVGIATFGKVRYDGPRFFVRQMETSLQSGNNVADGGIFLETILQPEWSKDVNSFKRYFVTKTKLSESSLEIRFVNKYLSKILYTMFNYQIAPLPWYSRLVRKFGIREANFVKILRNFVIKGKEWAWYRDPLGIQRRKDAKTKKKYPFLNIIEDFLTTKYNQSRKI